MLLGHLTDGVIQYSFELLYDMFLLNQTKEKDPLNNYRLRKEGFLIFYPLSHVTSFHKRTNTSSNENIDHIFKTKVSMSNGYARKVR